MENLSPPTESYDWTKMEKQHSTTLAPIASAKGKLQYSNCPVESSPHRRYFQTGFYSNSTTVSLVEGRLWVVHPTATTTLRCYSYSTEP